MLTKSAYHGIRSSITRSSRAVDRRRFLKIMSVLCMASSMPALAFGRDSGLKTLTDNLVEAGEIPQSSLLKRPAGEQRNGGPALDPIAPALLDSIAKRLSRLQDTVGYGNFCLFNFDEMLSIAGSYSSIGRFPRREIDCLETLFYMNATYYGFFGEKIFSTITDAVDRQRAVKIPGTGNYLYKGAAVEMYHQLVRDVGRQLILTAGIRGIVKQFYLFLTKALRHNGDLSFASRSIAPPGYSFHAAGDFDVGKVGYGVANFTDRFTETGVYARLSSLAYVKFRYPQGNSAGLIFEPWHIQVV